MWVMFSLQDQRVGAVPARINSRLNPPFGTYGFLGLRSSPQPPHSSRFLVGRAHLNARHHTLAASPQERNRHGNLVKASDGNRAACK